ncbi:MAG: phage tail assembly chaperone [Pseudomonadota bacterium]
MFDWNGLMKLGLGICRLRPCEFWALTPFELLCMAGIDPATKPQSRDWFDQLCGQYPDQET